MVDAMGSDGGGYPEGEEGGDKEFSLNFSRTVTKVCSPENYYERA
jgi:hypothetical protein